MRVVVDSTANLPEHVVKDYGIEVVPAYIVIEGVSKKDGQEISTAEFYEYLVSHEVSPETSQPSVSDFADTYRKLAAAHPGETIFSIHVSGSTSGTIESARSAAAQLSELPIKIVDSRSMGSGLGLQAREAADMIRSGKTEAEILTRLDAMAQGMQVFYALDTLTYLSRSGRIGRAARFLGTVLDMKPILTIKNGAVDAYEKHRSRPKAIEALKNLALTKGRGKVGLRLGVMHAVCEEEGRHLADELRAELKPDVMLLSEIGPSLGVYSGPGALAVCWWSPDS